jgi:hypothetical protein
VKLAEVDDGGTTGGWLCRRLVCSQVPCLGDLCMAQRDVCPYPNFATVEDDYGR